MRSAVSNAVSTCYYVKVVYAAVGQKPYTGPTPSVEAAEALTSSGICESVGTGTGTTTVTVSVDGDSEDAARELGGRLTNEWAARMCITVDGEIVSCTVR